MILQYKHQEFQRRAAENIVKVFEGQPKVDALNFHFRYGKEFDIKEFEKTNGFGNAPIEESVPINDNIRTIQVEEGIKPDGNPASDGLTLTVEMETGTGKTYTYIKTMFELHKRYGWSKFIVVVPSIAIREGVAKSFTTMKQHFKDEYDGEEIESFVYNSSKPDMIREFAGDNKLRVMIINMQAFNTSLNEDKNKAGREGDSAARVIFAKSDRFGSKRPIDILKQMRPIIIIDEPQSVLGADKKNATRKGLKLFHPLFTILYSATHRKDDIHNMVFRLDAIDAYQQHLVKKIEVKSVHQIGDTATNGFIYLDNIIIDKNKAPKARICFNVKQANGVKDTTRTVDEKFDLYKESNELEEYANQYVIDRIDGLSGTVKLLNGITLQVGDVVGRNEELVRRCQIRETILSHIERERQLYPRHIKVLSLFFIDHVENYRIYNGDETEKGRYAQIFEEEYLKAVNEFEPQFGEEGYLKYLKNSKEMIEKVHNGYFSMDKKGKMVDSKNKEGENEVKAFDLIMTNKERLLSLSEPTRFIFSHSALKEGWDNPNVFQICTLKDTSNEIKKRQEVGRGMRLCVNTDGVRQDAETLNGEQNVFDTNILTVIASESYEEFAQKLQTEIVEACESRPTIISAELFSGQQAIEDGEDGKIIEITKEVAAKIITVLIKKDYMEDGKILSKFHEDKKNGTLDFGGVNNLNSFITNRLDTICSIDTIVKKAKNPKAKTAKPRTEKFELPEWKGLWNYIKTKTYYKVNFKTEDLVKKAIDRLDKHLNVKEIKILISRGSMDKIESREDLMQGKSMQKGTTETVNAIETISSGVEYDLAGEIVKGTGLTRRTVVDILKGIKEGTFSQYKRNPEDFLIQACQIINGAKASVIVDGITYYKTDNYFIDHIKQTDGEQANKEQGIFDSYTPKGIEGENAMASQKSLYDYVVVDSQGIEMKFAQNLESHDEVVVYSKMPSDFYINTPMGKYNPDWAVAFKEIEGVKHIYFVAETKGTTDENQLREAESAKIECARKHFAAICSDKVVYEVVDSYEMLSDLTRR